MNHFMKVGMQTSWCGIDPDVAFDDWGMVNCPECRKIGAELHGKIPEYIDGKA